MSNQLLNLNPDKSELRNKLEFLENQIYTSWIKDLDKTKELLEIEGIIKIINNQYDNNKKTAVEDFFSHNQNDILYFINKFLKEVSINILRQPIIFGNNGDFIALKVLTEITFLCINLYSNSHCEVIDTLKEIFDSNKSFFKSNFNNQKYSNPIKSYSFEKFNEILPKKNVNVYFKEGDYVDVLIENKNVYHHMNDRTIWTRGVIQLIQNNKYIVFTVEYGNLSFNFDSTDITEVGRMTYDYEWRTSLKKYDVIDGHDRGKWYPSTIVKVSKEEINGLKKVNYKLGFRLYIDHFPQYNEYTKFWQMRSGNNIFSIDKEGKKYIGDFETMDEEVSFTAKRLQPFGTMIHNSGYNSKILEKENYYIDEKIEYIHNEKKTIIIGRPSNFLYFYGLFLKSFADLKGFDFLISNLDENYSADLLYITFYIIHSSISYFHKDYLNDIAEILYSFSKKYLEDLSSGDGKHIRKEILDIITKVLKILSHIDSKNNHFLHELEDFSITCSIKFLKSTSLDKRIQAIKTLVDIIKTSKADKDKSIRVLKIIEEHKVFNEIFGANSHIQLINKSQELLEIMIQEDKLSDNELEIIWNATNKGDLEGKLAILKLLQYLSKLMKPNHQNSLLKNIFNTKPVDLINDEIELLIELSSNSQNKESNQRKCISYLIQFYFINEYPNESEKLNFIQEKIIQISLKDITIYELLIKICLNIINKDSTELIQSLNIDISFLYSKDILCYYLLSRIIDHITEKSDFYNVFYDLLINNNNLVSLFIKNWKDYKANSTKSFFSIEQNIKCRLQFINYLLPYWNNNCISLINFLSETLFEKPLSDKDDKEFFKWVKFFIKSTDIGNIQSLFNLFSTKICNSNKKIQILSFDAFEICIQLFIEVNKYNNLLTFKPSVEKEIKDVKFNLKPVLKTKENKKDKISNENEGLSIKCDPESLYGFELLWKIVFFTLNDEIINKGISFILDLFSNVFIDQVEENEFSLISSSPSKTRSDLDYSNKILDKCLNIIKISSNFSVKNKIQEVDSELSYEENINLIKKSLSFLHLIIEESEKKGTAGIKSHSALLKIKVIEINILANQFNNVKFKLKLFANTTLWELKEIVSKKLKYSSDFLKFLKILKTGPYFFNQNQNGKSLNELGICFGDEIRIIKNDVANQISKVSLSYGNNLSEEGIKVFNLIFDTFSSENKMSKEDCSNFIRTAIGNKEIITVNDSRVSNMFENYDRAKTGFITREGFLTFYKHSIVNNNKSLVVWENLNNLGFRNDLKRFEEDYFQKNVDKYKLPRYNLSHNELFFDTLFLLQDLSPEIAFQANSFLNVITTNPKIYNLLLNETSNWEEVLKYNENSTNIYKLIYNLQIIDSLVQDIEFSNETNICEINLNSNEELNNSQVKNNIKWVNGFILNQGYDILLYSFDELLTIINNHQNNMLSINTNFFEILIKIIKTIFYYGHTLSNTSSTNSSIIQLTTNKNYIEMLNKLIPLVDFLILNQKDEEINILESLFEFIIYIITFNRNITQSDISNKLNSVVNIITNGIFSEIHSIRYKFSETLNKLLYHVNPEGEKFKNNCLFSILLKQILQSLISHYIKLVNNVLCFKEEYNIDLSLYENFFEITNNLLKFTIINDLFTNPIEEIFPFYNFILNTLYNEINISFDTIENTQIPLPLKILISIINILSNGIKYSPTIKYNILLLRNSLLKDIIVNFLFKSSSLSNTFNNIFNNLKFVSKDKIQKISFDKSKDNDFRQACYEFVIVLIDNSYENILFLLGLNLFSNDKQVKDDDSMNNYSVPNARQAIMKRYGESYGERREDHCGIKNLGCICYMISMLQQFFMTPSFRYNLLTIDDEKPINKSNKFLVDDNSLHQIQKMFTFLELSDRDAYNPLGFCYSYKDWDGNPVNVIIQQDSQEFLNRFFDIIEEQIKPSPQKNLINSIFGGKTVSEIFCEKGCGKSFYRFEIFNNLSLEVRNMSTLDQSLEKYINPEKVDNYFCDTCQKKVTITKRNSIAELPNVLIIHLQRITYNYEYDRNEKINSRLEFPQELNLKKYCIEDLIKKYRPDAEENDEIFTKSDEYYEYNLMGVNVHLGSADAGHYFSYINTIRNGNDNISDYEKTNVTHQESWLKFNDSNVSKFDISNLEEECFGGNLYDDQMNYRRNYENCQSAYMLIYERKYKNPVKTKVFNNETEILESKGYKVLSFKEEDYQKVNKETNLLINKPETEDYTRALNSLYSTIFHDIKNNDYYTYSSFYIKEKIIPKEYFLEVYNDNLQFQKQKSVNDSQYNTFIERVFSTMSDAFLNMTINSENEAENFIEKIFNIISKVSTTSMKNSLMVIVDKMIDLLTKYNYLSKLIIDKMIENKIMIADYFLNEDSEIVVIYCKLSYKLIDVTYSHSIGKIIDANNKKQYETTFSDYCVKILDFIFNLFPRIPKLVVNDIYPIYSLFKEVCLLSNEFSNYFNSKSAITVFVTFLIGRDSQYYESYGNDYGNYYEMKNTEPLIEFIVYLYKSTNDYLFLINQPLDMNNIQISDKDKEIIRNPSFLKYIYKYKAELFNELNMNFSINDYEFTLSICSNLIKILDNVSYHDNMEFIKVTKSIIPLLHIEDSFQHLRHEFLLGYPQIIIDDPSERHKYPIFGYNKIYDNTSRWVEIKSSINENNISTTLIKKIFNFSSNCKVIVEIVLLLLEECVSNSYLYVYLNKTPVEEAFFNET